MGTQELLVGRRTRLVVDWGFAAFKQRVLITARQAGYRLLSLE